MSSVLLRRLSLLIAPLLLSGCICIGCHDVTVVGDFSGVGALDLNRDGSDGTSTSITKTTAPHVGSQK